MKRFTVPAGVPCKARKLLEKTWRPHVTQREQGFDGYCSLSADYEKIVFHFRGWLLLVAMAEVTVRGGELVDLTEARSWCNEF